jgi:hypothetical protein
MTRPVVFAIAEQHAQVFPVPESALTVMAMTSGAAAASADLDSLYRDLRAAHELSDAPVPRALGLYREETVP